MFLVAYINQSIIELTRVYLYSMGSGLDLSKWSPEAEVLWRPGADVLWRPLHYSKSWIIIDPPINKILISKCTCQYLKIK